MAEKKVSVGGQAVIEGVMMKGPEYIATAVRRTSGEIIYRRKKLGTSKFSFLKFPFLRGVIILIESLSLGVRELTFSASEAGDEDEGEISDLGIALTLMLSLALGVGIFFLLPSFLSSLIAEYTIKSNWFVNILEGVFRLSIFVLYIKLISRAKDIKRVFEYHGSEHKSIYTFENKEELTAENAKKYTTLHPRCGTSFLLIVMIISVIIFSVVNVQFLSGDGLFIKVINRFGARILLLPLVAGVAYELQRFTSNHLDNKFVKIIAAPGMMLQKTTTGEPDNNQLEVAMVALKAALGEENIENGTEIDWKK